MLSRVTFLRAAKLARLACVLAAGATVGACGFARDAVEVGVHPSAVLAGNGAAQAQEETSYKDTGRLPVENAAMTATSDALAPGVPQPRHQAPHAHGDTDAPYMLDSGDRVRVFVYGQPNLSRNYAVDSAGFISVPLIGAVKTRGETTFDLERAITVQLGAKYVKDPKVSVEVAAYRPFYILGEVRTSGQYPFVHGMTVQTAVAIAGGYSERASEHKVVITRRVNGVTERLRVDPDMAVLPGDTIHVPERFF